MEINVTPDELMVSLASALRCEFVLQENVYYFPILPNEGFNPVTIERAEVENLIRRLAVKTEHHEMAVCDSHSYEVLILDASRTMSRYWLEDSPVQDEQNGITYRLGRPSDDYLIYLLLRFSQEDSLRDFLGPFPRSILQREVLASDASDQAIKVIDFLHRVGRFISLRIESEQPIQRPQRFEDLANSFAFNISFNFDMAIVPANSSAPFRRTRRILRFRRSRRQNIEAPRRVYIRDLVYHYQMAVSADMPMLSYLAYYHIIEHFFEDIFYEHLVAQVRNTITHPAFSYRNDRDLKKLIQEIAKSLRIRQENMSINELAALQLLLERNVNIAELLEDLRKYDRNLIDHYRNNKVAFSEGEKVDLESNDAKQILSALSQRIYKTRNAIVHSKENDKARFRPFKHEEDLSMEIPLMRFVAEQIVISNSEPV